MCIRQLLKEHEGIIVAEVLAFAYVVCGIGIIWVGLNPGSQLLLLFPTNPALPQIVGVITGVGISMTFFGISCMYTYYKDHESDRDIKNIQITLTDIKKTVGSLQGSFFPIVTNSTNEAMKTAQIEKIKLELEFEMAYLKAIGFSLAFLTAIIGFSGIDTYGKQVFATSVYGFPSITIGLLLLGLLAICFILLLYTLLCEYFSKMAEIKRIYNS
jgi:hypothetical protein